VWAAACGKRGDERGDDAAASIAEAKENCTDGADGDVVDGVDVAGAEVGPVSSPVSVFAPVSASVSISKTAVLVQSSARTKRPRPGGHEK
jgi:hypothetical protein